MSEIIKEAKLVIHYWIGYSLLLCKLMKTYLHYFIGKILSKHSSATVLIFNVLSWKEDSITSNNQYIIWKFNVLWVLHCSINWLIYGNIFRYSTTVLTLLTYSKMHVRKRTLKKQWMINNYNYVCHSSDYTWRFFMIQRWDESLFHTKFLYEFFGLMARPNVCFALETCVTKPVRSTFTQIQIRESMTKMLTSQSQEN